MDDRPQFHDPGLDEVAARYLAGDEELRGPMYTQMRRVFQELEAQEEERAPLSH